MNLVVILTLRMQLPYMKFFFKLRDQTGSTMVIVTHNDNLAEMADRKIILKDGKIIS